MNILSTLGAILVTIIFLPHLFDMWDFGHTEKQKRLAADHLKMVTVAAAEYVRKHD